MIITQTYKFFFEIEGNTYNFTIEDESLVAAKKKLKDAFTIMLKELTKKPL